MFSIIGIVVVFGAVVAGYLMEHGNLKVLMQPAELIIILGAAIGTVFVANPLYILTKIGKGIAGAFGGSPFTKKRYENTLQQLQSTQTNLNSDQTQLAQQANSLVGADLATSITNLEQATTATNAILSATGQILSTMNLLNFLK